MLAERFRGDPTVVVHHADAVKFDRRGLFPDRPVKFIGNLPYSCGGAILKNLLSRPQPFQRAVVMLQKEVIGRLTAQPGSKDYGILSLRTQVDWVVEPGRIVPPEAFFPRPGIDSAVAVLTPRDAGLPAFDRRLFDELVRRGFAQRRKQLRKQLPAREDWPEICAGLGLPDTVRAEELDLQRWVDLTRAFDPHPLKDLPQKDGEIFDVVDECDQVLRQATRGEVHRNGLLHRAVHVFVFNKRGDLLLQQRSMLKDAHPGEWDSSVSGHLDAGEDYDAAAVRELGEEMGIHVTQTPEEIGRIAPCPNTGWEHVRLYRVNYDGPIRFPAAEIESAMWFPPALIDAWIQSRPEDFATGFVECWNLHCGVAAGVGG
jgi:16S rRNA (adenine1518-N6/adenine1519-N6)-dimethyltransferase